MKFSDPKLSIMMAYLLWASFIIDHILHTIQNLILVGVALVSLMEFNQRLHIFSLKVTGKAFFVPLVRREKVNKSAIQATTNQCTAKLIHGLVKQNGLEGSSDELQRMTYRMEQRQET
jgi:hypothetical protein